MRNHIFQFDLLSLYVKRWQELHIKYSKQIICYPRW